MRHLGIAACLLALLLNSPSAVAEPERSAEAAVDKAGELEQAARQGEVPESGPLTAGEARAIDPAGEAPLDDPLTCLSRTLYWEAKGKSETEKEAVANVVMNRLAHEAFPDSVCEVVKEGTERPPCQFSWWCDGRADTVVEEEAFEVARRIARRALNQELPDRTNGALFFHDRSVMPSWASQFVQTGETEHFLLYRPADD